LNRLCEVGILRPLHFAILRRHARPEMPLAEVACVIPCPQKHVSDRELSLGELQTYKAPRTSLLLLPEPKRIAPGHDGSPARHTDRIRHVRIRKFHPVPAKLIEVRRIDIAEVPSKSLDVPITKIVSENEHDIRSIICCSNEAQKAAGDENKESRSNLHALGYAKI